MSNVYHVFRFVFLLIYPLFCLRPQAVPFSEFHICLGLNCAKYLMTETSWMRINSLWRAYFCFHLHHIISPRLDTANVPLTFPAEKGGLVSTA